MTTKTSPEAFDIITSHLSGRYYRTPARLAKLSGYSASAVRAALKLADGVETKKITGKVGHPATGYRRKSPRAAIARWDDGSPVAVGDYYNVRDHRSGTSVLWRVTKLHLDSDAFDSERVHDGAPVHNCRNEAEHRRVQKPRGWRPVARPILDIQIPTRQVLASPEPVAKVVHDLLGSAAPARPAIDSPEALAVDTLHAVDKVLRNRQLPELSRIKAARELIGGAL